MKSITKLLTVAILVLLIAYFIPASRIQLEEKASLLFWGNADVNTREGVDEVLANFLTIEQQALPDAFLKASGITTEKFKMLSPKTYYVIRKKDLYRKIAGQVRIVDLFASDEETLSGFWWSDNPLYFGIDRDILYKIIELRAVLQKEGWNENGFHITYGYRHPRLNKAVGGAPVSRHISGDALDIVVDDINRDGKRNTVDKDIVLDMCERIVIEKQGGIGRYPGTQVVHIDLRGKRARWDSY